MMRGWNQPWMEPERVYLSDDQLDDAVRKWAKRIDTQTIADQIGVPEHVVYNNLWRIKALATP